MAPPERVGTEKRVDEFGAYPLQCATPGHGPRIDMAASVGEYIAYSVGAFLACVSRVSATRDARRDATRRERSGAVLVPLWLCVNIKNTERGRDDATDDARTNERTRAMAMLGNHRRRCGDFVSRDVGGVHDGGSGDVESEGHRRVGGLDWIVDDASVCHLG